MAWTDNNTVCSNLYPTLVQLEQIDSEVLFPDAGSLKMSQLLFFNATASADIIRQSATALATLFDGIFTNSYLAGYQSGQSQALAITAMMNILVNAQNTVENLSDTIGGLYQFIS